MSVPMLFLAALVTAAPAQQPTSAPPRPSSNTPDDRLATPAIAPAVTVDGCVVTEAEVPSGKTKTTLGERVGLDRQFLLAQSKVVKGKAPAAAAAAAAPVAGEPAAPGRVYKISGLTDEQVKLHLGHRVRIEGRFGNLEAASQPVPSDRSTFVELEAVTIRQVPGDCAAPKS